MASTTFLRSGCLVVVVLSFEVHVVDEKRRPEHDSFVLRRVPGQNWKGKKSLYEADNIICAEPSNPGCPARNWVKSMVRREGLQPFVPLFLEPNQSSALQESKTCSKQNTESICKPTTNMNNNKKAKTSWHCGQMTEVLPKFKKRKG